MRYLYLVQLSNPTRSHAFRKPEVLTLEDYAKAEEHGYKWLSEDEAILLNLEIPNSSGHFGIITQARTWEVPVKLEDRAIWCYWLHKWYAVREYRPIGKQPSVKVMSEMEITFRLNSGLPINHDIKFIWKEV